MTRAIAPICVFLMLTGCASPKGTVAGDPLIGHWRYADKTSSADYTFSADGGFRGSVTRDGKVIWTYGGKWIHAGKVLSYVYTNSSADWAPPGTKDQDMLLEVDRRYYVIQAGDGSRRKYQRVE